MAKISNNPSGERWSAGLKWRAPRHDETDRDAIEMLNWSRGERHRQLRRRRQERVGGEIDRGADRAIIVVLIIAGLRRRKLPRLSCRAAHSQSGVGAMNAVEMDVPERDDELQHQRGQRQPASKPPIVKSNASGEMVRRRRWRPYRISLAREPASRNAIHARQKPIGTQCGAAATPLAWRLKCPLLGDGPVARFLARGNQFMDQRPWEVLAAWT